MADDTTAKRLRQQLAAQKRDAANAQRMSQAESARQAAELSAQKSAQEVERLRHKANEQTGSKLAFDQLRNLTYVAPVVAGGVGAWKLAGLVGKNVAKSQAIAVPRFSEIAKAANKLNTGKGSLKGTVKGDKIAGLVREAYHIGGVKSGIGPGGAISPTQLSSKALFAKAGGGKGFAVAVPLAVEGALSSYAPQVFNMGETQKETLRWVGSASLAGAMGFKLRRAIDSSQAGLKPSGMAIAQVTAAHDRLVREGLSKSVATGRAQSVKPAAPAASKVTTFRTIAGGALARGLAIGGPIAAGGIVFDAVRTSAKADGASNTVALAKASAAGVTAGGVVAAGAFGVAKGASALSKVLPTAGKVLARAMPAAALAMGAYSAVQGYRSGGVKGAAEGVADFATFGGYSLGKKLLSGPATGMARVKTVRMAMAQRASVHAAYNAKVGAARALAGPRRGGDGTTAGYTRIQGGRSVSVRSYRTPARGR